MCTQYTGNTIKEPHGLKCFSNSLEHLLNDLPSLCGPTHIEYSHLGLGHVIMKVPGHVTQRSIPPLTWSGGVYVQKFSSLSSLLNKQLFRGRGRGRVVTLTLDYSNPDLWRSRRWDQGAARTKCLTPLYNGLWPLTHNDFKPSRVESVPASLTGSGWSVIRTEHQTVKFHSVLRENFCERVNP